MLRRLGLAMLAALIGTAGGWNMALAQEGDLPPSVAARVLADAAEVAAVPAGGSEILRVETVEWTSEEECRALLGGDGACLPSEARTYVIWVQAGDEVLRYHTDLTGNVIYLAERDLDPAAVAAAPLPQSADRASYFVRPGDRLWEIAARFNVPVSVLAEFNHIPDPNRIYAGDRLRIPTAAEWLSQPAAEPGTELYEVQPGDALSMIALRLGVTVAALVEANDLADPNRIAAGQVLVVPREETPQPPPAPTEATEALPISSDRRAGALTRL